MAAAARRILGGRYRLERLIGEGAMSTVSCAHDELLDRTVALKLLKPAFSDDPEFVERFYHEARAAAKIVNPHVVAVYDVLSDRGAHAIVMEYVDGASLRERLAAGVPPSETDAVRYARETAQALSAAHSQGILHRDIKPANLLLTRDDCLKVADFGLAKALEPTDATMTQAGTMLGTVQYFSPEQAQGKPLTPASDLYSLGIVLYQLCSGQLPFSGDSPVSIALAHVSQAAPTQRELETFMSPALAQIVHRLLLKDPAKRFASAGELEGALAAYQHDRGIADRPSIDAPTVIAGLASVPPARKPIAETLSPVLENAKETLSPAIENAKETLVPAIEHARENIAGKTHELREAAGRSARSLWAWSRYASARVQPALRASTAQERLPLLFLAAVLLFVVGFGLFGLMRPRVRVANVVTWPQSQARAQLERLGLQTAVSKRPDERAAPGRVLSTMPAMGTALHRGDRVTLVVSSGPPLVAVPNVMGAPLMEAAKTLSSAKFHASFAARFSDAPASTVVEEIPAAGTRVRKNAPLLIVISTGPRPTVTYSTGGGD